MLVVSVVLCFSTFVLSISEIQELCNCVTFFCKHFHVRFSVDYLSFSSTKGCFTGNCLIANQICPPLMSIMVYVQWRLAAVYFLREANSPSPCTSIEREKASVDIVRKTDKIMCLFLTRKWWVWERWRRDQGFFNALLEQNMWKDSPQHNLMWR